MSAEESEAHQEIIIVKKNVIGGGGHHGGAWKIAYADFMTAMMALFLVLWLVNASDEETKVHLASYFNPVKLRDTITAPKGIQELKAGKSASEVPSEDAENKPQPAGGKEDERLEGALLKDPYKALDELAAVAAAKSATSGEGDGNQNGVGTKGDDAFGDAFDPVIWQEDVTSEAGDEGEGESLLEQMLASSEHGAEKLNDAAETQSTDVESKQDDIEVVDQVEVKELAAVKPLEAVAPDSVARVTVADIDGKALSKAEHAALRKAEIAEEERTKAQKEAERDIKARNLKKDIEAALSDTTESAPQIEVEKTDEGLVVRLTDHIEFEMFSIASTQPKPDMVVFMEKIAKVLARRPGQLVVMGHTDGRPFRSKTDNNWRLSAGRAQIAYHMLVRGGVDENRFARIEGHADRNLKIPNDPESAKNRRIEILLVEPNA